MSARRAPLGSLVAGLAFVALTTACDSLVTKPSLYGTVTAHVMTRAAAPIRGAGLTLYTGQRPMGYAVTDSSGAYAFVDVPEGLYGVLVTPPAGYVRREAFSAVPVPTDFAHNLHVLAQQHVDTSFIFLKLGAGTVTATVRRSDGTPVPQIVLTLYSPKGALQNAMTDASGRFVFGNVPTGNYGVFARLSTDSGQTSVSTRDGIVVDDGSRENADFTFDPCFGSIAATVLDSSARPVPGAVLTLYTGEGIVSRDTLGVDGTTTRSGLPCDNYGLRVALPVGWTAAEVRGAAFLDNLWLHRNQTLHAALTVSRIGRATIRVSIIDQFGSAVPNARVLLYSGSGIQRDVTTGADGRATMDQILVNDVFGVRVVNPSTYDATEGLGTSYVDQIRLTDGETRDLIFRFVRHGRATVRVGIVDQTGSGVPGAPVTLYTSSGVVATAQTAADGTAVFTDVDVTHEYGVRVAPPLDYSATPGRGTTFVDGLRFADGETRALAFLFSRP